MAVDDNSFYNILGNEVSRSILVQQMIDFYQASLQVGDTKVSDFNEGSEIRTLMESFAVDLYTLIEEQDDVARVCFVETADGEWLDKHGANPLMQLPRELGEPAHGYVNFTIPSATTSDVVIPIGTVVVSTENSLQYATLSDAIISVGETSTTVAIECLTVGADGNVSSNTITVIDDDTITVDNSVSVNNDDACTGGIDYEEDDEYRERLLAYKQKDDFGSIGYYENLCEIIDGVHDVLLVDATGYTKKVLVNGDTKPTPNTVLAAVLEAVTDVNNIVLTHTFTVDKPTYITKNLTVNLNVSVEIDEDDINELLSAIFDGGEAIQGPIFDGLLIGETLTKNTLYESFDIIEAVESVQILINGTEISDLTVNDDEVLKLGTVTINQTVVT